MAQHDYIDLNGLKGLTFIIPSQQRGYKWTPRDIRHLLDDLADFAVDETTSQIYCLQPLAMAKINNNTYEALDGQQRLTTLYLINRVLNGDEAYTFEFERDKDNERMNFLRKCTINSNTDIKSLHIDEYHIYKAYSAVITWREEFPQRSDNVKKLINGEIKGKSAKFIWYIINTKPEDEKAKHVAFRNLNDGKIELTNTDLIKALLLNDDNEKFYNVSLVAAQFEEIEQKLKDDSFWFMLQNDEPLYRNCRMDLLFNIAERVSKEEYDRDNTASFESFTKAKDVNELHDKWQNVRNIYIRLLDFYNDIEAYHYIGYLAYSNTSSDLMTWINIRNSKKRSKLIESLIKRVGQTLPFKSVKQYSYENASGLLRKLFVLHNIETIIENYKNKHNNTTLKLKLPYERFPFELLYRQVWQIEHISSRTDNILNDENSQLDWIKSSKSDFEDVFADSIIKALYKTYEEKRKVSKEARIEAFKALYQAILNKIDEKLADQKINNKNEIGNLVLLDSKTNQGYHNALFPAKRRWIIDNSDKFFYPICTLNVFTKFYNSSSMIRTWAWTKDDKEAYVKDMESKLDKFFV